MASEESQRNNAIPRLRLGMTSFSNQVDWVLAALVPHAGHALVPGNLRVSRLPPGAFPGGGWRPGERVESRQHPLPCSGPQRPSPCREPRTARRGCPGDTALARRLDSGLGRRLAATVLQGGLWVNALQCACQSCHVIPPVESRPSDPGRLGTPRCVLNNVLAGGSIQI
jgi:hypothetical protein